MIDRIQTITNGKITVSYSLVQQAVFVVSNKPELTRCFGGWDLKETFNDFSNSFTEETDFETACKFFTPNIGNYVFSN